MPPPFPRKIIFTQKNTVKYILPFLAVFIFTACSKGKKDTAMPYELPPSAPIPPEKYCFEQRTTDNINPASLELTIAGDSVIGILNFKKSATPRKDNFVGVIYGNTLIVKYMFKVDTGWQSQDQQWKISGDSIYKTNKKLNRGMPEDSTSLMAQANLPTKLFKVSCK
jgi:hypothetical protein